MMVSGEGGGRGGQSQDFELNLASIIDCMTVLIAFVLASASFLSITILDAGVAAAGVAAKDGTPPSVNITVELAKNHQLNVKLSGKVTSSTPLPAAGGGWNYEALSQNLGGIKAKWPDANAVVLTADNAVEYKDVVKSMEVIRQAIPVVMLDGF